MKHMSKTPISLGSFGDSTKVEVWRDGELIVFSLHDPDSGAKTTIRLPEPEMRKMVTIVNTMFKAKNDNEQS
jgi:hypothetical protein